MTYLILNPKGTIVVTIYNSTPSNALKTFQEYPEGYTLHTLIDITDVIKTLS